MCRNHSFFLPRDAIVFAMWCCDRDEAICLALGWPLLSRERNEHLQDVIHLPCFSYLLQMRWNHPEMFVSLHCLWREPRLTLAHKHLHYKTAAGAQMKHPVPNFHALGEGTSFAHHTSTWWSGSAGLQHYRPGQGTISGHRERAAIFASMENSAAAALNWEPMTLQGHRWPKNFSLFSRILSIITESHNGWDWKGYLEII